HTRSKRDWSSDVCSSDLRLPSALVGGGVLNYSHQYHFQNLNMFFHLYQQPLYLLLVEQREEIADKSEIKPQSFAPFLRSYIGLYRGRCNCRSHQRSLCFHF